MAWSYSITAALIAVLAAALISAALTAILLPHLKTHVMAAPNARSSHREPTPQGAGVAVMLAAFVVAWGTVAPFDALHAGDAGQLLALTAGVALLVMVGAVDDIRGLPPLPRLFAQCAAVGIVITMLPQEFRLVPSLPWWIEAACLLIGGVWLINLTNFMDGIDWMTAAEVLPIAGTIGLFGLFGVVSPLSMIMAAALFGAMLGFAPFNKPVASIFLGDAGSLPIGLVLAWLLLQVAASGHFVAATLLPLYYLADATLTLIGRALRRERLWQSHRSHFYQRANARGMAVPAIVASVFAANLVLSILAMTCVVFPRPEITSGSMVAGILLVGLLLARLSRAGSRSQSI